MPLEPTQQIIDAVMKASKQYGIEPALILAHMKRESDFSPFAIRIEPQINDASVGLMQVLVKTAQWQMNDTSITREQLYDIQFNVNVGTKYIAYNMKRYNGSANETNLKKAIAAYNAGSARYKNDGATFINQPYVDYVYGWYLRYKEKYQQEGGMMTALLILALIML